jgi:hypothetical protein
MLFSSVLAMARKRMKLKFGTWIQANKSDLFRQNRKILEVCFGLITVLSLLEDKHLIAFMSGRMIQ